MIEPALTRDRILDTAEEVLRRYGPAKATVVDVARALGVSHGSVYRHFPSKQALRDAVTERRLVRVSEPLEVVASDETGPAAERLRRWLELLIATKDHRRRRRSGRVHDRRPGGRGTGGVQRDVPLSQAGARLGVGRSRHRCGLRGGLVAPGLRARTTPALTLSR